MLTQIGNLSETVKAIMGVIVGVVGAIVTRITVEGAVLPDLQPFDAKGWLVFVAIAVFGYFGVYLPPNKQNAKQIDSSMSKLTEEQRAWVLAQWKKTGI